MPTAILPEKTLFVIVVALGGGVGKAYVPGLTSIAPPETMPGMPVSTSSSASLSMNWLEPTVSATCGSAQMAPPAADQPAQQP